MFDASPRQTEPMVAPKRFDSGRLGRILLYTAIVTFCLAAIASIGVILFGEFGDTETRILLSAFSIAAFSLAGLIATARFGRQPAVMPPLGLSSAAVALVLTLILIWTNPESDFLLRATLSVIVLAGAMAHANLLLADPQRYDPAAALLSGTLMINALVTAMIVLPILFDGDPDGGFYWKSLAVLGVLLVLGTLVVPVVRKISGSAPPSVSTPVAPAPLSRGAQDGWLEISYRGRTFLIGVEPEAGEQAGFRVRALAMDGLDGRHVLTASEPEAGGDAYTLFGHAVQDIARAVDEGRI
jgi:hypothetical protein